MSDLETTTTVDVQTDPGAEVTNSGEKANGATDNVESQEVQSEQTDNQEGELGRKDLPPELEETRKQLLRDYHVKTQKVSEEKKRIESELGKYSQDAETLQKLMLQPWFKKAMEEERSRRNGSFQEQTLTDEEFENVRSDKGAFQKYVQGLADKLVSQKYEPQINNAQSTLQELQLEKEFESTKSRFKDFEKLNDEGALDSYLDKGFDFETAYKQYKFDHEFEGLDERADKKAQELIRDKRDGAVATNGLPRTKGDQVMYASNLDDAFDQAWKAISGGNTSFKLERKKK